ncbi:hypothetical protein ILUMI_01889 [Ignelater luminosus]|uniref:non-specific serine/threonine protein kinase n=1 Tax=Ignelater luminosus TaxID=2038154 RepID=A0A8K0DHF2_IGNLU|nr:hypothetical protein ILUMI_01889 [Ignelater luminosus]
MAKPANKPRKKANGYKMPEPLPNGLILGDIAKRKWKLGPSIGKGGFGEIYSAQQSGDSPSKKTSNYPYVIKIEPHENGPLFVEMHFYMRNAKPEDIEAFKKERKLSSLGMPKYLGSGSHEHNGTKYRFVVMEKFGSDIWKIFLENNRRFPADIVFKLGIQILDVLEYIHSRGYIHADIKGANILLGLNQNPPTQAYLVDFGLCSHYDNNFKPNPKKAHNGTIEYLSRDAHLGVESRRGDLEILGYNLTQWLGCVLPWEKNLSDPIAVQNSKQKYMNSLPEFFKICFGNKQPPAALVDYFKYITELKFETTPDYKKLRKILISGMEAAGGSLKTAFSFKSTTATPTKRKAAVKLETPEKKAKVSRKTDEANGINKKTNKYRKAKINSEDEDEIQDEDVKKKNGRKPKSKTESPQQEQSDVEDSLPGYTAEMLRIKNKLDSKKKPQKAVKKSKVGNDKNEIEEEGSASSRVMRKRKDINYKDNLNNSHSNSVDIISGSDDEEYSKRSTNRKGRK